MDSTLNTILTIGWVRRATAQWHPHCPWSGKPFVVAHRVLGVGINQMHMHT